jgi:hypothetical protein
VYTGKALFGLSKLEDKPNQVLFIHTGGLPGLLAQASVLAPPPPAPIAAFEAPQQASGELTAV